jgi:hypothetical protein
MNIVMCHNQSFAPLARHLCRTFSHPKINIHTKIAEFDSEGFRSPGWYKLVRTKVQMLQSIFDESEDESVVGMIDCDIQCFSPESVLEVWEMMKKSENDYLSLAESCCKDHEGLWFETDRDEANTGFVLIKKTQKTQVFLQEVLSKTFEEKFYGDQTAINESLRSMKLKKVLLNPCLFLHGCCSPGKNIIMHHATCAFNFQQKMDQISWVRQQIGLPAVNWEDPSFGSSHKPINT